MRKNYKLLLLLAVCVFAWQAFLPNANAQPVKSISWDFNDSIVPYSGNQYGTWAGILTGNSSFGFAVDDSMIISYNKQSWSFIQVWNPKIDFPSAPYMSFKVRSDSTINLSMTLKDWHDNTITEHIALTEGADWITAKFDYWGVMTDLDTVIKEIQFNPGSATAPDSLYGQFYLDDFMMGEILRPAGMVAMATYAFVAPKIDGAVDGIWNHNFVKQEMIENITDGGTMGDGFAAKFKTMWDEDYLYVLVEVTDSTLLLNVNEDGDIVQDQSDYIDIFIDLDQAFPLAAKGDYGVGWAWYDVNDFQLKFLRDTMWTDVGPQCPLRVYDTASVVFAVAEMSADDTVGWRLEAKIPWDSLGTFTPDDAVRIGFDIQVGDANSTEPDSSRDGRVAWWNTADNNWEDPREWGILELYNSDLPIETSFSENFDAPVDLNFWQPNKLWNPTIDTFAFIVTQEDNALHIAEHQVAFPNGQMYTFTDRLFDLTDHPYASFKIKVDSGVFRDWQSLPQATIPFQMGPFSIDGVREHGMKHDLVPDGQWKRLYYDWSTPYAGGGDLTHIQKFLLESVTWPDPDWVYFWIDDFKIGSDVKLASDLTSTYSMIPPVIDGTVDNVWTSYPGVTGDSISNVTAGVMDGDFHADFKTIWDDDALYVLVQIKDSIKFWNVDGSGNIKQDQSDYVDIFLDLDRQYLLKAKGDVGVSWAWYDMTDFQLQFLRDSMWSDIGTQVPARLVDTASIEFATAEVEGGWVLEVKIPWDSLGAALVPTMKLGFDIQVGDADTASSRNGRYAWYNTADDNWGDPRKWGILEKLANTKVVKKTWSENFDDPLTAEEMDFFNFYMDSAKFLISQEDNALHIQLRQSAFYDGQFYTFDGTDASPWFDLTLVPHASMKIKVDSAMFTDWQSLPQNWVPMGLSPWSPDWLRQHQDVWNMPIDGEWHQVYYDWSGDAGDNGGQLGVIGQFLFESVTWPRADTAYFWIDDFAIGIAAKTATKNDTLTTLTVSEGTLVPDFAPKTVTYQVELPAGTTATPTVTATCSDANSVVVVTPAADVTSAAVADRTTTVVVTAQDWRVTRTYKVIFTVLPDAIPEVLGDFMLYPNPAADVLYLSNATNQRMITITNVLGQRVVTQELTGEQTYQINISGLEKGVYIVNVKDVNGSVYSRRIVIE